VHDQLFKSLLGRFFGDFVRIVLPGEASRLDLERAQFHRDEYFTDVQQGKRRLLDVVAEVRRSDDRSRSVLVHVEIESYLQLEGESREEYERLLAREPTQEVSTMQMTYEQKVEAKAMKRGREEGRVEGMRAVVLGQLERRFGPLSAASRATVDSLATAEELSGLADRVLDARSLDELGL